jgi:replication factor C small subunit
LHSRLQHVQILKTDHTEFTARAATVLVAENIDFDIDALDSYVRATYPDLRKCLQLLQQNSQTGQLNAPSSADKSISDWKLDCVELFKSGKIREARTLICQQSTPEETEDVFRWMYDNLDLWTKDVERQDQAIIIIRNGMAAMPMVADQEINLSATLCELSRL